MNYSMGNGCKNKHINGLIFCRNKQGMNDLDINMLGFCQIQILYI